MYILKMFIFVIEGKFLLFQMFCSQFACLCIANTFKTGSARLSADPADMYTCQVLCYKNWSGGSLSILHLIAMYT